MQDLSGKLLIASPDTESGSYFAKAVIYIINSDLSGSMGVIINFPFMTLSGRVTVSNESYNKENIEMKNFHTYSGGPVDIERGFILKLQKGKQNSEKITINSSIAELKKLSNKINIKRDSIFIFGHCGWGPGQLEEELRNDYWLVADASKDVIFTASDHDKWHKALENLKISPTMYSSFIGHC